MSKERNAIVKLDRELIERINREKESVIRSAMVTESERGELITRLCDNFSIDPKEGLKLKDLIEFCPEKELSDELGEVIDGLKEVAHNVKRFNDHNTYLVKESLGLIVSTLSIMRSDPGDELPTYGYGGKLNSGYKDMAFAKRIQRFTHEA